MTHWDEAELTRDAFLGGQLHLWQPRKGYRAGVDPILLAARVPAKPGQSVLDLGCGVGAAGLSLAARVPDVRVTGLERHPGYAALAVRNGAEAGLAFEGVVGDLMRMPDSLKAQSFDHVLANPPYYDRARGSAAPDLARETALGEDTPLGDWVTAASKRLRPKGYLHMVLKADRLADALTACDGQLGSLDILPLSPRAGREAVLILLRARKEGRAPLCLRAPVVLHDGDGHPGDKEHYAPVIQDVLRRGAALDF